MFSGQYRIIFQGQSTVEIIINYNSIKQSVSKEDIEFYNIQTVDIHMDKMYLQM